MNVQADSERFCVLFTGSVQGVGFRYTVLRLAAGQSLSGFISNRMDGTVYMEVEGRYAAFSDFLREIQASRLGRYIHAVRVERKEELRGYDGFEIV